MKINDVKKAIPELAKLQIVPMLVGESGVGKTESVRQVAQELGYRFINIRLGQLADAGDITGLPEFVEIDGVKCTAFMQPNFFPKTGEKAIVFFDEINRCHPDLLQSVFQAAEKDGGIGEYKFDFSLDPETGIPNTIRVGACNPPTDDYVLHDITDKAFVNRFAYVKFEPTAKEFLDYAETQGFSALSRAFLQDQATMLEDEGQYYSLDFIKPTRRTWLAADKLLESKEINLPNDVRREVALGMIGVAALTARESFAKNFDHVLKAEDVLNDFEAIKSRLDVNRLDLISNTNDEIVKEIAKDNFTRNNTDNLMKYILTIPKDSAVSLWKMICEGQTEDNKPITMLDSVNKNLSELDLATEYPEFMKEFSGILKQEQTEE